MTNKALRKRIYVAGPYSCAGRCKPLGVDLEYMRQGLEISTKLLKMGYAPFCPWLDYIFKLVSGGSELSLQDYYDYSIAFLPVCHVMYVHDYRVDSVGVNAEIELAESLLMPVFYVSQFDEMIRFLNG